MYAWIIDTDHLADNNSTDAGIIGPRNAPAELIRKLKDAGTAANGAAGIFRFTMRDDDGELYYTGRMATDQLPADDDACYGPLSDFGAPNAGCVEISYSRHPEMDCG